MNEGIKRIIALLLTALMVLSLAACGEKGDKEPSGKTDLAAAAEKLKSAKSYRLVFSMENKAAQEKDGVRQEYHGVNTLTCLLTRKDGVTTINAEEKMEVTSNGQTNETVSGQYYFNGKEAYVLDPYDKKTNKIASDTDFDMAYVMDEVANMVINSTDYEVLKKIEQLNPKKSTSGGVTSYELNKMKPKDFAAVYAKLGGDMDVEEIEAALSEDNTLNMVVKVNKDGYLTEFRVDMLNITAQQATQDMIITFAFDQIDQVSSNEAPDFVKSFVLIDGMEYTQIANGKKVRYVCRDVAVEKAGFWFEGFSGRYDDEYTVDSYEIAAQIEGKPVTDVGNIVWNGNITVERLIIPAGAKIHLYQDYEGTTLFFKDNEQDVEKNFIIAGQQDPEGLYAVKAAYYAGQWEMVNNIPTPKN